MIPDGGTIVRPGVVAWDGVLHGATAGYYSCEAAEQAILEATRSDDPAAAIPALLEELARARMWLPLPDGAGRVTDGSALALPVLEEDQAVLVPAFTSVQRLATWCDPRSRRADPATRSGPVRSGDPAAARELAAAAPGGMFRHVVVPFPGLVSRLPSGVGITVNPGTGVSLRVFPDAMECLRQPA